MVLANLWAHSSPQIATRIMLPNEVFALACRAYYEEQGLIVDKTNGEFAHCPYPEGMGDTGYYLLHGHHQHQGLLQSRDVGRQCFFTPDVKKWLITANYFPDNYFELWDIFKEYSKPVKGLTPEARKKSAETRTKNGNQVSFLQTPEARAKAKETRRERGHDTMSQCHTTEAIRKRAKSYQKAVEVTFPNGKVGVYPSVRFTTLSLGIGSCTLYKWLKGGVGTHNRLKGYSARYL